METKKKRHEIEKIQEKFWRLKITSVLCVCLFTLCSNVTRSFLWSFRDFCEKNLTFQVGIDRRERRMRILLAFCHYIFQCSGEIYIFLCVCSGCCCCYGDTFRDMCYIKLGGARSVLDLLNLSKMIIT